MMKSQLSKSLKKFFKFVLPSDIEDQKLSIPVKSEREFGDELSDVATLTVPNGDVWKVGLERSHNKIWFVQGWQKLITHYSIKHGMFLVFGYQGNSTFHVCIFDYSCCEIEYPPTIPHASSSSSSVKGKEKCVKIRKTDAKKMNRATRSDKDFKAIFLRKISAYTYPINKCGSEYEKLVHATTMFKLESPFFAVILNGYNFSQCNMRVPRVFTKKYMRGWSSSSIRIEDSKGKCWELGYNKNGPAFRIGKGCSRFFKDNYLEEGDVCLFELIKKMRDVFVLRVSVLRNAEYVDMMIKEEEPAAHDYVDLTSSDDDDDEDEEEEHANNAEEVVSNTKALYWSQKRGGQTKISKETKSALRKAKALSLANPAFMVILRICHIQNCYVYVPAKFAKDHMRRGDMFIKLEVGNEQWSVVCNDFMPGRRTKSMKNGWKAFVKDNDLNEGDVCVMEMIKKTEEDVVVFKVSIFRARDYKE